MKHLNLCVNEQLRENMMAHLNRLTLCLCLNCVKPPFPSDFDLWIFILNLIYLLIDFSNWSSLFCFFGVDGMEGVEERERGTICKLFTGNRSLPCMLCFHEEEGA